MQSTGESRGVDQGSVGMKGMALAPLTLVAARQPLRMQRGSLVRVVRDRRWYFSLVTYCNLDRKIQEARCTILYIEVAVMLKL